MSSAPLRVLIVDDHMVVRRGLCALLDTEDKRFYEHSGIDYISLANDTLALVLNCGEIRSGASTITI